MKHIWENIVLYALAAPFMAALGVLFVLYMTGCENEGNGIKGCIELLEVKK